MASVTQSIREEEFSYLQEELRKKTILQQEAKLNTFLDLRIAGLPVPNDILEEIRANFTTAQIAEKIEKRREENADSNA